MSGATGPQSEMTPKGMRPHLVVKLKPDWRHDATRGAFVSRAGENLSPGDDLPPGSRIEPMVRQFAEADPKTLSEDERNLARYVYVILPKRIIASDCLETVRQWACVEEVRLPPEISLP